MAVTTSQIRDLLNRPRGLNEETISEYITIRTQEVTKKARSASLYGLGDSTGVETTETESAIKMLVACDCLRVMLDTIPSYVPENMQRQQDIRVRAQLARFEQRADELLAAISEAGGTAFAINKTDSRQDVA